MPEGCRSIRAQGGPWGSTSGEELCGKWVIVLDDSADGLVRSGSGAGGQTLK